MVKAPLKVRALWDFIVIINRANTEGHRSIVLHKSASYTFLLIKIFAASFSAATTMFVLNPMYDYFFKHETTLLVNLYLPFINPYTSRGFIYTILYQLVMSAYAIFGNMGYDLFMAMFVANYDGIVAIFECQLNDLVQINRRKDNLKNRLYRLAFLRNVYIQLLDATE